MLICWMLEESWLPAILLTKGRFKVPTLRNIEVTFPYMHDGRFSTLEEVLDHYNDGLQLSASLEPQLAYTMETGLMLTEEDKADLIAFSENINRSKPSTTPSTPHLSDHVQVILVPFPLIFDTVLRGNIFRI